MAKIMGWKKIGTSLWQDKQLKGIRIWVSRVAPYEISIGTQRETFVDREFKTKPQALKFAYAYMRRHPFG